MKTQTIADYNITVERDHEQYWHGHGIAFTKWDHSVTGHGSTECEALSDALDQLAEDVDIPEDLEAELEKADDTDVEENEDWYFYVSIDFNLSSI